MTDFDASRVGPKLWVGGFPPADLEHRRLDVVVLCAAEKQDVEPDIPTLRVRLDDAEFTDDEIIPIFAQALRAAVSVSNARKQGKRVLVTCRAGVNRSALVAAISLVLLDGLTADQAVEQVRNLRGPRTIERWGMIPLCNQSFVRALRRFDDARRRLRKGGRRARPLQGTVRAAR